jgi:steroid delta-isomerase-like uncharacterized protein
MSAPLPSAPLEANKSLVRAHYDSVTNRFDPEAIRAQVHPDFFDHQSGRRMSVEEVIEHSRTLHATFRELEVSIDDMVAEGDLVAVRATWSGVHAGPFRGVAPTGKRVAFTGMVFWRIADGKVAERWAEVDFGAVLAKLAG